MEQINGINVELLKGSLTELSNMVEKLSVNDKFDNDEFEKRLKNYINRVELLTGAMNELSNMVEKLGVIDSPIGGGQ